MQKAELILVKLNQKSQSDKSFKFRRLYRNLYKPDFYLYAYSLMYSKPGNMTKGSDGKTIDGFSRNWITETIEQLKYERYNPTPVRRVFIPKKNGKMRPLGIPSIKDKLVQMILKEILEAIYEPLFSNNSHGFRPNRSCQTALHQIKRRFSGASWIIEGDIKGFFDNINHKILIDILKEKIEDGRVIELIKKFLKAGYMQDGIKYESITGAPQGGIISPVLSNIYLHNLDNYMEKLILKYRKGKVRKRNPAYKSLTDKRYYRLKKGRIEEANEILKQILKTPCLNPMDSDFVRIKYVRYADDFVVGIWGSKELAKQIRDGIAKFLNETLNIELSMGKTLITNILKDKTRFLGYEFHKAKDDSKIIKDSTGKLRRSINGIIQLRVPRDVINSKIKQFSRNGKPIHRSDRVNMPIIKIIKTYNSEIRGLYNYYRLAYNVGGQMGRFKHYHYFSLIKTICRKKKLSMKEVFSKYGIIVPRKKGTGTKNVIGMRYKAKNETKTQLYFNDSLKRIKYPFEYNTHIETGKVIGKPYCELIARLQKGQCEMCKNENIVGDLVVHHVKKLELLNAIKDENIIPDWIKLMKKLRRKTLVVCTNCHDNIHKCK